MRTLLRYLLRGILIVAPAAITVYIILTSISWADTLLSAWIYEPFGLRIPGLGLLSVLASIILIGYIFSRALTSRIVQWMDHLFERTPIIKIIYTSIRELLEAFVGEKRRFKQPVLVDWDDYGTKRLGFITEKSAETVDLPNHVAVYLPHSYNVSGNLYFIPKQRITNIDVSSSEAMRYVVAAGVTTLHRHRVPPS